MARNQEKAQAMLNKFLQAKKDADKGPIEVRPYIASEVTSLPQCERWRNQVIREIAREVTQIQNGGLGEHKVRDMNDKINKLLREKKHWERQIKKLGGPDYEASAPKITDVDGKRAMGNEGYFYFGAAKELPGVRELFEKSVPDSKKRTRGDLYKLIDADYYGYKDEDDGLLVKLESAQEKNVIDQEVKRWKATQVEEKKQRLEALGLDIEDADPIDDDDDDLVGGNAEGKHGKKSKVLKAHVTLPSDQEIQKAVIARKKKELLTKYAQSESK